MDFELKDKIAVVTGASRGIGRAIAEGLAREGCQIAAVATAAERVADTVAAVESLGVRAKAYGADIADFESVQALGKEILGDFGEIDILVNNAGVTRDGLFLRMSEENWDLVIDTNLKGAFNTCRAFTRTLMKRGGARVINIASIVGLQGNAGQVNYAASKGGLVAFTKALARELSSRQVCVNAIAPGFIETDMTSGFQGEQRDAMRDSIPLKRFGSGDDIAAAAVFLAGRSGAYITGQTLVVDGGIAI
ncbi:MAG: 3-oxoacyl-[acyl-carrier-protein] reductase [Planctomycetota bacterium]